MDLFWDYGPAPCPRSRDDLERATQALRDQLASNLQSVTWTQGGQTIHGPAAAGWTMLRRMLQKLAQLDGTSYGAEDDGIVPYRFVCQSTYGTPQGGLW